jgi:hypothetical protein
MDQLATTGDADATPARITNSRSMSATRLSPSTAAGPGSTPQLLRTRQASAESTTSVSSRFGPDSAFLSAIETLAAARHTGKDAVLLDTHLLGGLIGEMEDMKDAINALQKKYSGAKVGYRLRISSGIATLMSSAQVSSIVKVSLLLEKSTTRSWLCVVS